jgi:2-oxoisovalerate dehydrogenase E1 component alpha subunit
MDVWTSWPDDEAISRSVRRAGSVTSRVLHQTVTSPPWAALLPTDEPLQLIDEQGAQKAGSGLEMPDDRTMLGMYRHMSLGRRFDSQATALTKQGRLAVYPSSHGQEACQVSSVLALREQDWLFPTYRDSVAILSRGVDPVEVLTLLRGDWHCGYDPYVHHVAPQCTPLATNTLHAVGLAHAAKVKGEDTVALVLLGDGATSEGDTHEALNFAGVWKSPVVFLIQNNGYAISVPLSKQSAAPSLAHKGIGYGVPSVRVDGNDPTAVFAVVRAAIQTAARGGGPTLIEAITYRIEAHTNADDATRYREAEEVERWLRRDPLSRIEHYLTERGLLDQAGVARISQEGEQQAAQLRTRMNVDEVLDPLELFEHVYVTPSASLRRQQRLLTEEIAAFADEPDHNGVS